MPIDGKKLAEATFGKHNSTDEFLVVDELYPHVLIGPKLLCDNKCQVDIENETLKIRIRDQDGNNRPTLRRRPFRTADRQEGLCPPNRR